jgi:hypothetical protein
MGTVAGAGRMTMATDPPRSFGVPVIGVDRAARVFLKLLEQGRAELRHRHPPGRGSSINRVPARAPTRDAAISIVSEVATNFDKAPDNFNSTYPAFEDIGISGNTIQSLLRAGPLHGRRRERAHAGKHGGHLRQSFHQLCCGAGNGPAASLFSARTRRQRLT